MRYVFLHIALFFVLNNVHGQESVFTGFKGDMKKADELFQNHAYHDAIEHYQQLLIKNKNGHNLLVKIASSYYALNDMESAVSWYSRFDEVGGKFDKNQLLNYSFAMQATGDYENTVLCLQKYVALHPEDLEVSQRIWQLQNIKYLYEDSIYYQLKPVSFNSEYDEYGPVLYGESVAFSSNRKQIELFNRIDASSKKPFSSWYIVNSTLDSTDRTSEKQYSKPSKFASKIKAKYHKGTVSFSKSEDVMVFSRTSDRTNTKELTSKIYFASIGENGEWEDTGVFPFNSDLYSLIHPYFTNEGTKLYFSSDMPGGIGGMDLYYSDFVDGSWSAPENLGDLINTSQNEGHPFYQNDILYFSSNGHPGFGGLDVFKVDLSRKPMEVGNLGFPINTHFDDFNLILDHSGQMGYMVSNRNDQLNINDDIFEVSISKRTFPLFVKGKVSYKKSDIAGSTSELIILADAKLELIDKVQQHIVQETFTDSTGIFKIEIPYESQYVLSVKTKNFGTAIVSMDIPLNYQNHIIHDIVIVEDFFKSKIF